MYNALFFLGTSKYNFKIRHQWIIRQFFDKKPKVLVNGKKATLFKYLKEFQKRAKEWGAEIRLRQPSQG